METINYKGNSLNVEFTRDAEAGNYGTDGVRYQQDGVINSQKVRVYWNTTPSFNENSSRYKELINLQSESGLDEDDYDELCYLECFFSDNSKACDWGNADEITLEDGSEFFTASPLKITKKFVIENLRLRSSATPYSTLRSCLLVPSKIESDINLSDRLYKNLLKWGWVEDRGMFVLTTEGFCQIPF